ncbi:hypothetical protein GGX14DRAFT_618667 [Mycena pura]|uniref:Uncharacterized protein n=1 Tax=Mycena pura TaxID=153505 RepID=A0AAD6YDH4_9AGAR|nr:hypothetical protein GGX14DRAFT_618667 [Mycena pura]
MTTCRQPTAAEEHVAASTSRPRAASWPVLTLPVRAARPIAKSTPYGPFRGLKPTGEETYLWVLDEPPGNDPTPEPRRGTHNGEKGVTKGIYQMRTTRNSPYGAHLEPGYQGRQGGPKVACRISSLVAGAHNREARQAATACGTRLAATLDEVEVYLAGQYILVPATRALLAVTDDTTRSPLLDPRTKPRLCFIANGSRIYWVSLCHTCAHTRAHTHAYITCADARGRTVSKNRNGSASLNIAKAAITSHGSQLGGRDIIEKKKLYSCAIRA